MAKLVDVVMRKAREKCLRGNSTTSNATKENQRRRQVLLSQYMSLVTVKRSQSDKNKIPDGYS